MSPDGKWVLYNKLKGESDNALWITNVDSGESFRVPGDDRISAETMIPKGFICSATEIASFFGSGIMI